MQLKDRDGIACDQCGTTYRTDFSYYSFDFRQIPVQENRRPDLHRIHSMQQTFSLDICTQCFDSIKDIVIANYSKTMTSNVKHRGRPQVGIQCELTGEKMVGTFVYYHCNVVKVQVRMSSQPIICVKCQKQANSKDQPCEHCGGTDFLIPADTKTDDRFLEIHLSEPAFKEMVTKAENLRKVAGEWATKS